jgi:hypothetical protein
MGTIPMLDFLVGASKNGIEWLLRCKILGYADIARLLTLGVDVASIFG